jgi:hypothetical protein
MVSNMGSPERAIRIVAGIALLCMVVFVEGNWRWAGLVGLVPLITGLVRWCPVYAFLTQD